MRRQAAAILIVCLTALAGQASAGGAKLGADVVHGHVVLRQRVQHLNGNEEMGEYELLRMRGDMSSEDSVAWLKGMTPGKEIAWVDRKTKGLALEVDVPNRADTLRATVYGPDFPIQVQNARTPSVVEARSFAPMVPDIAGVCHLEWDLRSSAKKRVGPGLYVLGLTAGEVAKEFYVVVAGTP